jgi:hypothetical protein
MSNFFAILLGLQELWFKNYGEWGEHHLNYCRKL